MRKLIVILSLVLTVSVQAQQSTLRLLPFVSITPAGSSDMAPLIQRTLDLMTNAALSDVFSGVRGGKLCFANGTFLLFSNIFFPDYWPVCYRIEGAGFNGTIFEGRGADSCTNRAMFSCITNHVQGLALTNALSLFVSDCGFIHTNETQTNFLWDIVGQTFAKFEDCMFSTKGAMLNGQGGYSLNYEANYPNQPVGLVGLAASKSSDNANAQIYVKHCLFDGLAAGVLANPVVARVQDSYFVMCGKFNTTPPPANTTATLFAHTNLWRGLAAAANSDYRGWLSTGAALVFGNNTPNVWVTGNVFFDCGAMAAIGLDGVTPSGGHTLVFRDNYIVDQGSGFATKGYRFLTADSASIVCSDFFEGTDFAMLGDSLCTNGPVGNPSLQPNAAEPTVPIPTIRMAHSGTGIDNDSYFVFTSGGSTAPRMIANGSAITNVIAQSWSGNSGNVTVPAGTYFFPPNNTASNCVSFTSDASGGTRGVVIRACNARNFYTVQSAGGGSGKHYTYTVMKNGSTTTLVADSNNATSASDTTHIVAFAAGDEIGIKLVVDAASTAAKVSWSLEAK